MKKIISKNIGSNTRIWDFVIICDKAVIGNNCNICSFCFIENDVVVGNNVTIKTHNSIWDGITIGDNVFIGHSVIFTNDRYPKPNNIEKKKFIPEKTIIKSNTSIGAGSVILPGVTIGFNVMIGAGSIITKNVPDNTTVYGTY
jgi:UDP-2-acetamido-3-amino-2,3-dideoxy-glucuronate N-acetyltransferase